MCQELSYAREGSIATPWGRIWYGIAGTGPKPPLLTLHGGPGATHYYFMGSIGQLADERPVVFYDQLGCGRSDRPTDTSLWTAERFAEELAMVVHALGLTAFHLWGHSWGTALAVLYALTRPQGMRSMTLTSPVLDIPTYREDVRDLVARQPPAVQEAVRMQPPDSTASLAALEQFYHAHVYAADTWDACTRKAFSAEEFGPELFT